MITTLVKYQSNSSGTSLRTKSGASNYGGICNFKIYLPVKIKEYLGRNIVIKKVDFGFTLRSATWSDNSNVHVIKKYDTLTLSKKYVNEFEDLGDYEIDPDYENEIVYLIKIK